MWNLQCNDSGLCYKTTIITNLALATIVNYDCRVTIYDHKTSAYLMIVIHDRKTFVVLATG
jgi:hypothetical protein